MQTSYNYVLPDGRVIAVHHDAGEEPRATIDYQADSRIQIGIRQDLATATERAS